MTTDGFRKRTEAKKRRILTAAFKRFAAAGCSGTSIQDIAELAEVAPATIYNYYGTKETLITETLIHWAESQLERYEQMMAGEADFERLIAAVLRAEADNLLLIAEAFGSLLQPENELWQTFAAKVESSFEAFFLRLFERGKREGYIRPSLSPKLFRAYFRMYMQGLPTFLQEIVVEGVDAAEPIEEAVRLFFYGVAGGRNEPQ